MVSPSETRQALLSDYYRAKAMLESQSVKADDVTFARLVSLLIAARRAAFEGDA